MTVSRSPFGNNFDFLRLVLASMVIFSHSFPLTGRPDLFGRFTDGWVNLGEFAVDLFFVISGFLIVGSLQCSKDLGEYLFKRLLRVFPALFVMLLLTVLLLWGCFGLERIGGVKGCLSYIYNNLSLYRLQYGLGNVFAENQYPLVVNGSLWSLAYEFSLYLLLCLIFPLRHKRVVMLAMITSFFLFAFYAYHFVPELLAHQLLGIRLEPKLLYRLTAFFMAGGVLSLVDLSFLDRKITVPILFVLLVACVVCGLFDVFGFLLLPPLVVLIGTGYDHRLDYFPRRIGDISYGMYIYGFPIQQLLQYYLELGPYVLFLASLSLTALMASLSWHYVERRFLALKSLL